jgi:predicted PurR-regulated permease PerM
MDELPDAPCDQGVVVERIDVRTAAVTVIVLGAVIFGLREGVALFAPVLVSVLLAYALQPFVAALTRCRLPPPVAAIVVYVLLAGGVAAMAGLARRQVVGLLNDLPHTVAALKSSLQREDTASDRRGSIEHLGMTAAAGGLSTAIAAFEGNLISPWLTSRAGELNTVAVFVSVLFWGWMWDAWGLVLAVPIMVAIKAAADHIEPLQPFGELLGR